MKYIIYVIISILSISCTKERVVLYEKKALTNAENIAAIKKIRLKLGLSEYPIFNSFKSPFYYPHDIEVGEIYYNNEGYNEALVIEKNNNIATTFEGCRDSTGRFFRKLKQNDFGEFKMLPCSKTGNINDSADVYSYFKK